MYLFIRWSCCISLFGRFIFLLGLCQPSLNRYYLRYFLLGSKTSLSAVASAKADFKQLFITSITYLLFCSNFGFYDLQIVRMSADIYISASKYFSIRKHNCILYAPLNLDYPSIHFLGERYFEYH